MLILQDVLPQTAAPPGRAGRSRACSPLSSRPAWSALTGGLESPFTFSFPLIVGAGALLVAPRIALALAVLATAATSRPA